MNKFTISIIVVVMVVLIGSFLIFRDGTGNVVGEIKVVAGTSKENSFKEMSDSKETSATIEETLPEETPANTEEKTAGVTITYYDNGFSPSSVTIEKGQTVKFVNESGKNMWIASNSHPTHTIYPEKSGADCLGSSFDACTRIAHGDSWSFTFGSVGSWKYHDHLSPGKGGAIIVQ